MISAEKVFSKGKYWIKVTFKHNTTLFNSMMEVKGCLYNASTGNFAVPYENRADFERKMGDYLIIWENEEDKTAGGIPEANIPDQPVIPGYSVTYNTEGEIIDHTGFKTRPWGEFQVRGFNVLVTRPFLILADDAGLGKQ